MAPEPGTYMVGWRLPPICSRVPVSIRPIYLPREGVACVACGVWEEHHGWIDADVDEGHPFVPPEPPPYRVPRSPW